MTAFWRYRPSSSLLLMMTTALALAGCSGESESALSTSIASQKAAPGPVVQARTQKLMAKAQESIQNQQPVEALEHVRELLKLDPIHRQGLFLAGAIEYTRGADLEETNPDDARGMYFRALQALEKLAASYDDLDTTERELLQQTRIANARRLTLAGKPDEAVAQIEKAVAEGFDEPEILAEHPHFASLQSREDFQALKKKVAGSAEERAREVARRAFAETRPYAFDFDLPNVDGRRVKLADVKGRVTIVDLWGTWCGPCRVEIPHFIALLDKYKDRGLAVVGLNFEQGGDPRAAARKVREAVNDLSIPYPCLIADETVHERVPGFNVFPTTLFLDREGKVRAKFAGVRPAREIEAVITSLLEEAGSE